MAKTKRQDLPAGSQSSGRTLPPGLWPGLWIVATPIGNLGDLSPRARSALEAADGWLAEDTRRARELRTALGISGPAPIERLDAHTSPGALDAFASRLAAGESWALVTDAGTPAVSDPGAALVARAAAAGVRVVPVPGPSAVLALLSVAGFQETAFGFRGFFPRESRDQERELGALRAVCASAGGGGAIWVWFESPQRIGASLAAVAGFFAASGEGVEIVAAKELTKLHERVFRGSASEVATQVGDELNREGARGEWSFAVRCAGGAASAADERAGAAECSHWVKTLECLRDAGVSASEAARQVSQHFGVARGSVYERALEIFGKKNVRGD